MTNQRSIWIPPKDNQVFKMLFCVWSCHFLLNVTDGEGMTHWNISRRPLLFLLDTRCNWTSVHWPVARREWGRCSSCRVYTAGPHSRPRPTHSRHLGRVWWIRSWPCGWANVEMYHYYEFVCARVRVCVRTCVRLRLRYVSFSVIVCIPFICERVNSILLLLSMSMPVEVKKDPTQGVNV